MYSRFVDYTSQDEKERAFLDAGNIYKSTQDRFDNVPGAPIAYWVSDTFLTIFNNKKLGEMASPRQGLATGCNDIFTRLWYECDQNNLLLTAQSRQDAQESGITWFPYNKGGEFRKWYGNNDYVVNWRNDGFQIRNFKSESGSLRSRPQNMDYYFRESITWSKISSGSIAFRYKPCGHVFDVAGTSIFTDARDLQYLHGFCNSKVTLAIANVISPTLNYEVGHIASLPIIIDNAKKQNVIEIVNGNISLSKQDWDSFETSWDFVRHPLAFTPQEKSEQLSYGMNADARREAVTLISARFDYWQRECDHRFSMLKSNEEELNRIFIDIYGLRMSSLRMWRIKM